MVVIVDSSVWIDYLEREVVHEVVRATAAASTVLSPLVIAELLSGNLTHRQRYAIGELLQDYPMHETPLQHWIAVGELRRMLRGHGINATLPDAHVAQCALDLGAVLLTRDDVFTRIAKRVPLRLAEVR